MRSLAEVRRIDPAEGTRVRFLATDSSATGLPDGRADVVTCAQALHWMEPEATLAEVARILRPGGVFAAYDYDWPPTVDWQVELAFGEIVERSRAHARDEPSARTWPKQEHLARLRASGRFRYVNEILLHGTEPTDEARVIGLVLSLGRVARALAAGATERDVGIDRLRRLAHERLARGQARWHVGYRVRIDIR